jgi:hypothetical protein
MSELTGDGGDRLGEVLAAYQEAADAGWARDRAAEQARGEANRQLLGAGGWHRGVRSGDRRASGRTPGGGGERPGRWLT